MSAALVPFLSFLRFALLISLSLCVAAASPRHGAPTPGHEHPCFPGALHVHAAGDNSSSRSCRRTSPTLLEPRRKLQELPAPWPPLLADRVVVVVFAPLQSQLSPPPRLPPLHHTPSPGARAESAVVLISGQIRRRPLLRTHDPAAACFAPSSSATAGVPRRREPPP
ncbi:uncharacterized protein [Triticum aestivum]|uniref:uncharacterized protein n=1 Tax=Triticum aestivum TaxID=4565 RepID=UPI001D032456|nr:uncharacterized protein LOC123168570 [Triticum aestivum]